MNNTLKRHIISGLITFLTIFFVSVGLQLTNGALSPDAFTIDAVFSIVLTAVRAGVKGFAEAFGLTGDN